MAADSILDPASDPFPLGKTERQVLSPRQRGLLFVAALICFAGCYAVLGGLGLPTEPGFSARLLEMSFYALPLVAITFGVLTLLVRYIVGNIRADAALFCAAAGLIFLPAHGGDIRQALLDAGSASVYVSMAFETALLGAVVLATYSMLFRLTKQPNSDATTADRLTAVVGQAVVVLVAMMILGQSPAKGQAMAAAALGGFLGVLAVHQFYGVRGSGWYVAGTFLAGVIAHAFTFFNAEGLAIGDVRGLLAGPARSLPLHYATAGVAGTIFGYWTSVVWYANRAPADEK